jgi:hypothetical protein
MVLALILTAVAFISYTLAVRRCFDTLSETLLAAFVLTNVQIVVVEILVGFVGFLRPVPLVVANLVLSAIIFALAAKTKLPETYRWILRRLAGCGRLQARSPLSVVMAVLLMLLSAWLLWLIAIWPASSYDGIAYHLAIAFSRIDFGDMRLLVGWPPWLSTYPEYAELLMAWTAIFDQVPAFVDGAQWAFWPAGILAVYTLARRLGCSPTRSFQGSALFAFCPAIILQTRVAYNDLMVATLFVIALNLLLRPGLLSTVIAGLSMGLIVGIKYGGIAYPILGGLGLLVINFKEITKRTFWMRLIAYAVPVLALGTPWYLANWLNFANPLSPFTIQIGGLKLFRGMRSAGALYSYGLTPRYRSFPQWLLKLYFWLEPSIKYTHDAHYEGLGPLWPILGIPAVLYMFLTGLRERKPTWTMVLVGMGGLYLVQMNNWKPRYSLFILALGGIGVAWVLHTAPPWVKGFTQALIVAGILWTVLLVGPMEMISIREVDTYAHLPAELRPHISQANVPAYRWLEENTYEGARIIYGYGLFFIAPLWENDLDNHVLYVETRVPEMWHREIVRQNPNFVYVQKHFSNRWIGTGEGLVPVYTDRGFVIYQVSPMELEVP